MDWFADTEMVADLDSDNDDDDENEIRQLDAALEEADIQLCETSSVSHVSSKSQCEATLGQIVTLPGLNFQYASKIEDATAVSIDTEMIAELDSDDDDENEIRQLDAALGEADIEFCETSSVTNCHLSSQSQCKAISSQIVTLSDPIAESVSKIEAAVAVNKIYEEKLRRLERTLGLRLQECRAKLAQIQSCSTPSEKQEVFRYINCGRPYFRDHKNYPAPDNEDTVMAKSQMYDFSLVSSVPGWTVRDKNQFTDVMTKISLDMRKRQINEKIEALKRQVKVKSDQNKIKEIESLRKKRDSLSIKMPFVQLALPLDQEYDWDMLANKLNRRHTAHEYRCLWKLYFHPSINKSTWNKSEHTQLQILSATFHQQDWDEIAKQLGTGRTGYQCFVYFRTNMANTCIGKKWTPEEITYLKRLIDYFREDCYIPWGKIAAAMENRTKIQIYNKYLRLVEQRKGRFLPEEDAIILNCTAKFGTNFRRITEFLPHRSMVQIRARYNVLNKMRISVVWSVEDDRKLVEVMSNRDSNLCFSSVSHHFPGRNRVTIRSRYTTLVKWMKKHPNMDLEHAPRRGARRLNHGHASDDLNKALENLKDTLNSEVKVVKERKKLTRDSDHFDLQDAILATIVNEEIKEQNQRKKVEEVTLDLPNLYNVTGKELDLTNLHKCLVLLGACLNRKKFDMSHYKNEYHNFGNCSQDVSLVKVKSYSKLNTVKTIKLNEVPDVWGNCLPGPHLFVMPPQYSTIIGCRSLMSHVKEFIGTNLFNLHILVRKNSLLRKEIEVLLERFYVLFLWPMLMSNEAPSSSTNTGYGDNDSSTIIQNDSNSNVKITKRRFLI